MPVEVLPHVYRIEVPLPNNPLKALNSYVITGERNLVVDTGMNRRECLVAMRAGLEALGADPARTDFFLTHLHADHTGLVAELAGEGSRVYFSALDASILSDDEYWQEVLYFARLNGFPAEDLQEALEAHPGYRYSHRRSAKEITFSFLKEGDTLDFGEYRFYCLETPGHTKGHLCLYEPEKKVLFAGDHILRDITPNISLWCENENPLRDYLASLEKISQLEVNLVLPGHRSIFSDCRQRIEELKRHHRKRAAEVLDILREGELDAYQVAARMNWDLSCPSWELFPVAQKWFAHGEAIAHLKYLEEGGLVAKRREKEKFLFRRR